MWIGHGFETRTEPYSPIGLIANLSSFRFL